MSVVAGTPSIKSPAVSATAFPEEVPSALVRSTLRLEFPPSYVVVGAYRLLTDKSLLIPAWNKCKHAARRGFIVAFVWTCLSFRVQRDIVAAFLLNSPKVTLLRQDTFFGYPIPFDLATYATIIFLSSQIDYILIFFLRRNIRIARDRAWAQTVASRGKGPDFWQPYVEEWEFPPIVDESARGKFKHFISTGVGRMIFHKVLTLPFALNPVIHAVLSAGLKAVGIGRYLHKPYFEAKKMTRHQIAVFVEERKWDYRTFGFTAALLEGLPIIGSVFTISNRVGAAMWAHDLEKRQHYVTEKLRKSGGLSHDEIKAKSQPAQFPPAKWSINEKRT